MFISIPTSNTSYWNGTAFNTTIMNTTWNGNGTEILDNTTGLNQHLIQFDSFNGSSTVDLKLINNDVVVGNTNLYGTNTNETMANAIWNETVVRVINTFEIGGCWNQTDNITNPFVWMGLALDFNTTNTTNVLNMTSVLNMTNTTNSTNSTNDWTWNQLDWKWKWFDALNNATNSTNSTAYYNSTNTTTWTRLNETAVYYFY